MRSTKDLIIAGGGTGGHVLAGIAVGDAWRAKYPGSRVLFVGSRGGLEEKLVARAGHTLKLLDLGSLKGVGSKRRMRTLLQLPIALMKSVYILLKFKPTSVLGVGGYASGPLVLAARLINGYLGAKIAILEQNAVPGLTNRLLARVSDLVLLAFPGVEDQFSGKTLITGNPVRSTIKPMPPATTDPFTVFIFGGSQGARGINSLVIGCLADLEDLSNQIKFIHQTGEQDYERVKTAYQASKYAQSCRVEKFIYDMAETYRDSTLIISRSGSSTLSELAAVRRASILIPFPFASDNHQEKNALLFAKSGSSIVLLQEHTQPQDLGAEIRKLFQHPQLISKMENCSKDLDRPGAAERIIEALV